MRSIFVAMTQLLTLIVPVKNGARFIGSCIEPILTQTFNQWRLVILDNQSDDDTAAVIGGYLDDPRISYVVNPSDIGMIGNFNKALQIGRKTKYFAILSHDDYYCCDDALSEAIAVLDKDPEVAVVYSHLKWVDERGGLVLTKRFATIGKTPSDLVARNSITSCRNLFGVPLVARSEAAIGLSYDGNLYHTVDIDFSIAIGSGRSIYHIDRECFAIRFHQQNNTMRKYSHIAAELRSVADKHRLRLSPLEHVAMRVNDLKIRLGKWLFFLYLDQRWQFARHGGASR
jgi:glycosyltransferase involved in cell wall biosynthesis